MVKRGMEENSKKNNWTYIRVEKSTKNRLKSVGGKGETYDDILKRVIKRAYRGKV